MNGLTSWLLVAGTVVGLAVGQVLFKVGAIRLNREAHVTMLSWINGPIIMAVVIYGVSTVLWIGALRSLSLRVAYPASALGFVLVPLLGHVLLGEQITARTLIGAALIILGVVVSTWAG